MGTRPQIELELSDTGTLGTLPCSTLRLQAHEPAADAENTILAILHKGAALRPGPRFGGEANALLILDDSEVSRRLPLAYAFALGQVARHLCDRAARTGNRTEPIKVWYARRHASPTTATRIYQKPLRQEAERERITCSWRMTP